jgi:hypothetical protein
MPDDRNTFKSLSINAVYDYLKSKLFITEQLLSVSEQCRLVLLQCNMVSKSVQSSMHIKLVSYHTSLRSTCQPHKEALNTYRIEFY